MKRNLYKLIWIKTKDKTQNNWLHNSPASAQYLVEAPFWQQLQTWVCVGRSVSVCMHTGDFPHFLSQTAQVLSSFMRYVNERCVSCPATDSGFDWGLAWLLQDSYLVVLKLSPCGFSSLFIFSEVLMHTHSHDFSVLCLIQSIFSFTSHPQPAAEEYPHSVLLPLQPAWWGQCFLLTPNIARRARFTKKVVLRKCGLQFSLSAGVMHS